LNFWGTSWVSTLVLNDFNLVSLYSSTLYIDDFTLDSTGGGNTNFLSNVGTSGWAVINISHTFLWGTGFSTAVGFNGSVAVHLLSTATGSIAGYGVLENGAQFSNEGTFTLNYSASVYSSVGATGMFNNTGTIKLYAPPLTSTITYLGSSYSNYELIINNWGLINASGSDAVNVIFKIARVYFHNYGGTLDGVPNFYESEVYIESATTGSSFVATYDSNTYSSPPYYDDTVLSSIYINAPFNPINSVFTQVNIVNNVPTTFTNCNFSGAIMNSTKNVTSLINGSCWWNGDSIVASYTPAFFTLKVLNGASFTTTTGGILIVGNGTFLNNGSWTVSSSSNWYLDQSSYLINIGTATITGVNIYVYKSQDLNQGLRTGSVINNGLWIDASSGYLRWISPGDFFQGKNGVFEYHYTAGSQYYFDTVHLSGLLKFVIDSGSAPSSPVSVFSWAASVSGKIFTGTLTETTSPASKGPLFLCYEGSVGYAYVTTTLICPGKQTAFSVIGDDTPAFVYNFVGSGSNYNIINHGSGSSIVMSMVLVFVCVILSIVF